MEGSRKLNPNALKRAPDYGSSPKPSSLPPRQPNAGVPVLISFYIHSSISIFNHVGQTSTRRMRFSLFYFYRWFKCPAKRGQLFFYLFSSSMHFCKSFLLFKFANQSRSVYGDGGAEAGEKQCLVLCYREDDTSDAMEISSLRCLKL